MARCKSHSRSLSSSSLYLSVEYCAASSREYPSFIHSVRASGRHLPPSHFYSFYYLRDMSGFLSSEAEMALLGEEEEAQRLFHRAMMEEQEQARRLYHQGQRIPETSTRTLIIHPLRNTRGQVLSAPLTPARTDSGSHYPPTSRSNVPYINQTPWSSAMSPSTMAAYPQMQPTPTLPSSPYVLPSSPQSTAWPNQSWSALHPEGFQAPRSRAASGSDISRSSSPNPAELHNFGYPLPDGCVYCSLIHISEGQDLLTFPLNRRSWRCAHPGCTSPAVFTRGCDLRKHFRRHTKSLFCRHEDCPQSTEGGFSSKKDRDRHEAKHRPGVPCQWEGCERLFSRVDNMKDHMRRIHRKSSE